MTNIKCTKESDRNHSALRTSKQHEQNKTNYSQANQASKEHKGIKFPTIFCCLLTLYYTHVLVLLLCWSFLFPTSRWFTLPFSFSLVYSRYSFVPVLRSLMCFVSLSVGSTINYYNVTKLMC